MSTPYNGIIKDCEWKKPEVRIYSQGHCIVLTGFPLDTIALRVEKENGEAIECPISCAQLIHAVLTINPNALHPKIKVT